MTVEKASKLNIICRAFSSKFETKLFSIVDASAIDCVLSRSILVIEAVIDLIRCFSLKNQL